MPEHAAVPRAGWARRRGTVLTRARLAAVASAATAAALLTASPSAIASPARLAHGSVTVLYAGSLLTLMQQKIDPAFKAATGYTVNGISAGSKALATQIKSGVVAGDVFISASPTVNDSLAGPSNGNWVSSYDKFGDSALVLGYNPSSKFAAALKSKGWYDVVDLPGFLLGRTDPATDPKGVLAVNALDGVALSYARPALAQLA